MPNEFTILSDTQKVNDDQVVKSYFFCFHSFQFYICFPQRSIATLLIVAGSSANASSFR